MKKQKVKYRQILEAAIAVIAENGYHGSQIAKIAKEAGVADGTIYLYFKNKEDLLIKMFAESMGEFISGIESGIAACQTAKEKLARLVHLHLEHLSARPKLAVVTQLELRQSQASLQPKLSAVLEPYLELIEELVSSGMKSGEFRSGLNVKLARQMIFGTVDQAVTSWVLDGGAEPLAQQAPELHSMLYSGLANCPGNDG